MKAAALIRELQHRDIHLIAREEFLHVDGPANLLTDDLLKKLREQKTEILSCLVSVSAPTAEEGEFAGYEPALKQGLLVICRHCRHYRGPHSKALGWCRKFDTEAAPDVPFTCGAASRA